MGEVIRFKPKREEACSFCNKPKSQVKKLMGNGIDKFICNECLAGVTDVLQKAREKDIN